MPSNVHVHVQIATHPPDGARCARRVAQRLRVARPPRRSASAHARGDRKSDGAAGLQAGADADAEAAQPASYNPNSLWRNGSRAFFKDQRAHQIGDILTVTVNITDKANIANETQRSRTNKEDSGITDFLGSKTLTTPAKVLPGRILTADSTSSSDGKGSVNRQEALQTNVAAVVTQVLPNGNLVVEGKQEIRVNFEMRELIVAGIVRPEDIQSDNTIDSTQDRAGAHRLWRPRPDHRRAAAALRPAGDGRAAAVLRA